MTTTYPTGVDTAEQGKAVMGRPRFWEFSSRNRTGHKAHPLTEIMREAILIYWNAGWTQEAIGYVTDLHVDTVNAHLRRARRAGDTRAQIRHAATKQALEMAVVK